MGLTKKNIVMKVHNTVSLTTDFLQKGKNIERKQKYNVNTIFRTYFKYK